jgi:hypothetical protein
VRGGYRELNLVELLRDPLVRLLMTSDGVTDAAMCSLLRTVRGERRAAHNGDAIDTGVLYPCVPLCS